jgi:hypothetical protein
MVTNANPTEWLREQIAMESEGERSPAQPDIQIRADFPRRAFCLYVNGEPVGVSSQYKALWHTRNFLMGELAS